MQREQLLYRKKPPQTAVNRCMRQTCRSQRKWAAQKVTTDFVLEDSFLITNVGRFALPEAAVRMYSITARFCRARAAVRAAHFVPTAIR